MQIGDRIGHLAPTIDDVSVRGRTCPGTVVYIHPQRRFYTVRFDAPGGKFCESFYFYPRCAATRRANETEEKYCEGYHCDEY